MEGFTLSTEGSANPAGGRSGPSPIQWVKELPAIFTALTGLGGVVASLLKWPTCSAENRSQLIEELARVTGEDFGQKVDDEFRPDILKLIQWAEAQGFDPGSPPQDPEPISP